MKITADTIKSIAADAHMAARENAHASVRENHPATEIAACGGTDGHPAFHGYYVATLNGILDSLGGRNFGDYGAPKPLTDKQIAAVRKEVGS
jgi:hypothetical protein